jgi:hypothetical protein
MTWKTTEVKAEFPERLRVIVFEDDGAFTWRLIRDGKALQGGREKTLTKAKREASKQALKEVVRCSL